MRHLINFFLLLFVLHASAQKTNCEYINSVKENISSVNDPVAFLTGKISESQSVNDTLCEAEIYKLLGSTFFIKATYDSSLFYYKKSLELAKRVNAIELSSDNLHNIAATYSAKGEHHLAVTYALQALEIDRNANNIDKLIVSLNGIASIYKNLHLYDKAIAYQIEAINLCEENNKKKDLAIAHFNLAEIYLDNGKLDDALVYFNLSKDSFDELILQDSSKIDIKINRSEVDYSLGLLYSMKHNYDVALVYFNKALAAKTTLSDNAGMSRCYFELAHIQFKLKKYDVALDYNFKALPLKLISGDKEGLALLYTNIAKIKMHQGVFNEALLFIQKSSDICTTIDAVAIQKENYYLTYQILTALKKYEEALRYHVLFSQLQDTLFQQKGQRILEEMMVKFETEKTEKENELLQKNNDIKDLTIQKQKVFTYMMLGIVLLVLIIVVIVYRLYKQKQKANVQLSSQKQQIEQQKEIIEEKNKDLTDSIHYAKRIQDSMLGHPEQVLQKLQDYFIFFQPKDIVSGDFYWAGEKNGKIIFSAIDCTGHGVPGAFMSMLGDSYLNQIIYNRNITSPDEILTSLHYEIQEALNQGQTKNQDGMDMVICSIDLQTKIVEFAGAKNPLVYIQNGDVFKIKGDNQPIGGGTTEKVMFTKHTIHAELPTCFYMFSDGYQDQFGGPKGKKFMIKKMQQILLEIHTKSMNEQHAVMKQKLREWMGDSEQIDDVVLIGFKL